MVYRFRNLLLVLIDMVLINIAVYTAMLLRFDGQIPVEYINNFIALIPIITIITLGLFFGLKLYHRVWEYASITEMAAIFRAVSYSMILVLVTIYLFELPGLPRSIYILSWLMINIMVGLSRISWRLFRDVYLKAGKRNFKRVLIIGAGNAGVILAKEIGNNPHLTLKALGFIDDEISKHNRILCGLPVLGGRQKIPTIVNDHEIDEIIVAMPSVSGGEIRKIYDICRQTPARVRILPGIYQSTNNNLYANIRDLQMEDLLRREPIKTDLTEIARYIKGKGIMVTGAGGSIGSELCRQILGHAPRELILIECSENNLFDIEVELKAQDTVEIHPELVDVRNPSELEMVYRKYMPQVIFHAAAFKHVPMMERHPQHAVQNNVIGSKNVAELADYYGVETFIFISTDKAVNPTSVMGASKRIAELVIKDIARNSQTKFASVRFGNVLGSRGSVIPTFQKQIEKGGPVTVTDPEMRRYFMTIPEAVQLVIQAGAMTTGGEIFILDMGEMVKIDDLARDLIRLVGYEPDKDIKITYTGIRPGEKLYEELFTDMENMSRTKNERIFITKKEMDDNYIGISKSLGLLLKRPLDDPAKALDLISTLIPEYQPTTGTTTATAEVAATTDNYEAKREKEVV